MLINPLYFNNLLFFLFCIIILIVQGSKLDNFKEYKQIGDNKVLIISNNNHKLIISWLEDNILRIQGVDSEHDFSELKTPIVVTDKFTPTKVIAYKNSNHLQITNLNTQFKLLINYQPIKIKLLNNSNQVIFEEVDSIEFNKNTNSTTQLLKQLKEEEYFGGGMQNGRFSHRNTKLNITTDYNYVDGNNPNPVPFYMSTNGYGVFRNTFSPGNYDFNSPLNFTHNELRLDAYYFLGNFKQILNKYTYLTGRPFMPPIYGLQLGDSDCYYNTANGRPPKDTLIDSTKVADGYIENDLPLGYMILNDGFNCGYTRLNETNEAMRYRNVSIGLWTNSDLSQLPNEVSNLGVKAYKLDGTWVGPGYEFSFNACNEAYNGIENYSNSRGLVWSIEGWAGVQKCGIHWSGDQYGTFETIRYHIPTIHGSGLSSLVYTSSDLNGIGDGSPITYIRDLQFKVFSPTFLAVSGWAEFDKQPWRFGEPGTSINRKYLKLRSKLLPYIYTFAKEAHNTGVPIVRSMLLEFPNDKNTWDKEITKYQYMFGNSFLVAPVYKDELKRDDIYLPKGNWIDYWNGKVYEGPITLNNYNAPLDILPLFVKENSIIPMWNPVNNYKQRHSTDAIILDIYPSKKVNSNNQFTLYEDDYVTRQFKNNQFTQQTYFLNIESNNNIKIKIGKILGTFDNATVKRPYYLTIHLDNQPKSVQFNNSNKLNNKPDINNMNLNIDGWYYDKLDRNGILYVIVQEVKKDNEFDIKINF
ncbi:hypothetical protein K502DRAFT_304068 [Neoconidiobolus thromboides FSU 785]|nr:hypothetical protein K502DRAFT_304068 [Neoconidiobolus thromboides FSU 785]